MMGAKERISPDTRPSQAAKRHIVPGVARPRRPPSPPKLLIQQKNIYRNCFIVGSLISYEHPLLFR